MERQDNVIIPFLIAALAAMLIAGVRWRYRRKPAKSTPVDSKRYFAGSVFLALLIIALGVTSHEIPFLIFVLLGLPALAINSWFRLKQGKPFPPKRIQHSGTIAVLLILLMLAAAAASRERIVLFPSNLPTAGEWLGGGIFLTLILTNVYFGWRRLKPERKQALLRILPEKRRELWIWAVVSLLAAIAEECAYRGVAYTLLWEMTGSVNAAIAICIVAFGISHAPQGWKAVVWVGLLGWIFHITVILTGTLYVAIGMHAAYDFVLGLLVVRLHNRDRMEEGQMTQPGSLAQD